MTPKHPKPKFKKSNNYVRMSEMKKIRKQTVVRMRNIKNDIFEIKKLKNYPTKPISHTFKMLHKDASDDKSSETIYRYN